MGKDLLSIDDVLVVQILDGEDDLSCIELSPASYHSYCSSERRCFLESKPKSSPPGQYSRAKKSFFSFWKEWKSLTMKGWSIPTRILR